MSKVILTTVTLIFSGAVFSDSTIGPHPEGVSYEITATQQSTKPDPLNCGYNDLGMPILGLYEKQTRRYTKWANNQPVRYWVKSVDIFVDCQQV